MAAARILATKHRRRSPSPPPPPEKLRSPTPEDQQQEQVGVRVSWASPVASPVPNKSPKRKASPPSATPPPAKRHFMASPVLTSSFDRSNPLRRAKRYSHSGATPKRCSQHRSSTEGGTEAAKEAQGARRKRRRSQQTPHTEKSKAKKRYRPKLLFSFDI